MNGGLNLDAIEELILLVGHNPMPLYISIAALHPRVVHWVYSEETRARKDDLMRVVRSNWPDIQHKDGYCIDDPYSPRSVAEAMSRLPNGVSALNYTGGTKVMTVHAHSYWMNKLGGTERGSLYIDGKNGFIRFDSGEDVDLEPCNIKVSVDDAIDMHGLSPDGIRSGYSEKTGIRPEHWRKLAEWAVNDSKSVSSLYELCKKLRGYPGQAIKEPIDLRSILPEDVIPDFAAQNDWPVGSSKSVAEKWGCFLTGDWLEDFVAEVLETVSETFGLDMTVAKGVSPKTRELKGCGDSELDVLAVRGYRIFLVSCTTDVTSDVIKRKCYEALNRVQSIGGGLARASVVCLSAHQTAQEVEKKAKIAWQGEEGTITVFSKEDVSKWLSGDYMNLVDWLQ